MELVDGLEVGVEGVVAELVGGESLGRVGFKRGCFDVGGVVEGWRASSVLPVGAVSVWVGIASGVDDSAGAAVRSSTTGDDGLVL